MAELMGTEVIDSLAVKIRAAFSDTELVALYQDKPIQGFETPCVFFHPLNSEHAEQMFGRATQNFLVDIRVHPSTSTLNIQSWAREIARKMLSTVRTITVSEQAVKCRSTSWSVQEDVLHIIVSYAYRVIEVSTDSAMLMETLEITEGVI